MADIHSGAKFFGTRAPTEPSAKIVPPEPITGAPAHKTVPVYVRKGSYEGERVLSFSIPSDIPAKEIIGHGFAVDGNRAAATVEWFSKVEGDGIVSEWLESANVRIEERIGLDPSDPRFLKNHHGITRALHAAEVLLVEWLEKYGYEVEFK